jgi:hypothetical protein
MSLTALPRQLPLENIALPIVKNPNPLDISPLKEIYLKDGHPLSCFPHQYLSSGSICDAHFPVPQKEFA